MTPEMLQDALCEEIKRILSGRTYLTPAGKHVPMNVFPQSIPLIETDEEEDPFPYAIVRMSDGADDNVYDSKYIVEMVVIVGIYSEDKQAQGHRELLNVFNLVYERFKKNPSLDNQFVYDGGYRWTIQEDDYFPYYFGAFKMNFAIPAIRREDPFA